MRFARLAAPAFGPFTDFALDLSAAGADLHLVFGPNEAGKSSLLRAVSDLLYGIPARTSDGFLHDYGELRIAATLIGRDGRALKVQRRKGNKNTLLDADGNSLPEDALRGLLGVVDRDFFSTVFALDSEALRNGAESLLQGRGDLGEALFSASLAGTPVHRIRAALEAEAKTLFDGRKTKDVSLRPLVNAYKTSLDASRDARVRPEDWEQALSAVADAESDRERLDQTLSEKNARRDWVQRCLDALPAIGALAEQERLRAELPPLPDLGPGFVSETEQALATRDAARTRLAELEQSIARLQRRVAENQPELSVLARAAEIESLHEERAIQQDRRRQLDAHRAEHARLAAELTAGMRELGIEGAPAAVEQLRAGIEAVLSLKAAAQAFNDAIAETRAHQGRQVERRHELEQLEHRLQGLQVSEPSALRDALARTEAAAQFATRLAELEATLAAAARDCATKQQLLPGAPADTAAACALPLPAAARLRQFADEDARIAAELTKASEDTEAADGRARQLADDLARLQRRGTLPTEHDLAQARAQRDRLWQQVLAQWRDGAAAEPADSLRLQQDYPRSVRSADEIADRLRAEADAVARAESLREQQQSASDDADRARQARAEAERARADWLQRWQATWKACGLEPAPPQQMQEWRDHWLELRDGFKGWQSADAALRQAQAAIDEARARLCPLLPDAPADDLLALRASAARRVREADEARGARAQLETRQRELRAELDALGSALPGLEQTETLAQRVWQQRCRALGLPLDADTTTVLALLERRNALVELHDRWHAEGQALAQKRQDAADYDARVQGLAEALGRADRTVDASELALWQALAEARELKVRQDQARRDLSDEQAGLPTGQARLDRAEQQLSAQRARAAVADEQALAPLLDALKRRHALDAEIERQRQSLHITARGEALDAFIERVRSENRDALSAECDRLHLDIAELQQTRDQALRRLHEASAEKTRLQQSGLDAAAHLQDAKAKAARIGRDAARYLRLQLAVQLLRELIERYRRESQGPLLARAGELFQRATDGSFDGLGTAFASDDRPILVGLRGKAEIGVDGMSDGTRDQLYLSLRIAAIERHLEHHEPMPMILDDLLMTFDDRRCQAILPMLRELAGTTQVLLFTHHRHLLDLAQQALGTDGFHRHELGSGAVARA